MLHKISNQYALQLLCLFLLPLIFYQVLYADYAYLDEAHQLWHNQDGSNYTLFMVHGRPLTGWIIDQLFSAVPSIAALKFLRIISFLGWILTIISFSIHCRKWVIAAGVNEKIVPITTLLLCCSASVAIYIGWASCLEIFLATACGLFSGNILFNLIHHQQGRLQIPTGKFLIVLALGLISLFMYQIAFGIFLLPFFIYYLGKKFEKLNRTVVIGIGVYLFINGLYYLLFKYSMKQAGVVANERTDLSFDVLNKIAFFFSTPLAQAFSFNFLYNIRGLFSQLFYYGIFACWVVSLFLLNMNRDHSVTVKFRHLLRTLVLLGLIYLPILVAKENFASYRTMLALNLAGCILIMDTFLHWIQKDRYQTIFMYSVCCILIITGFINFKRNFIEPLRQEYHAVREYLQDHYSAKIRKIYFIRPPESLFRQTHSINVYRDEFGLPSTFKDWTPDPLVRQIITEMTGNRKTAEKIEIVQFSGRSEFDQQAVTAKPEYLIMDAEAIIKNETRHGVAGDINKVE